MADGVAEVGVDFTSTGSEADIARELARSVERAMATASASITKALTQAFSKVSGRGAKAIKREMAGIDDQVRGTVKGLSQLEDKLANIGKSARAVGATFGDTFDDDQLAAITDQLGEVANVQDEIARRGQDLSPLDLRRIEADTEATKVAVRSLVTEFQQSALAFRESEQNKSREQRRESRRRQQESERESSKYVVDTQRAGARELASIRATSNEKVALTRAAARRRVAVLEFSARAIRTIERSLTATFQGTARVLGRVFTGIGNIASSTARGVSRAFRKSSDDIVTAASGSSRAMRRANQQITNSYTSSWRNNERIVNNSLQKQSTSIQNFAAGASSAIGGIGLGGLALAGTAGLVVGRALTGGFQRAAILEESERALTILLGEAEAARDLRDAVLEVVTGTPFKLDQFADAATQLVAFNVEAEKIPGYLDAIGNAAAVRGGGAGQAIDTLVRVFGQVSTTARITLTDINSIAETGVPALDILGNAYNVTANEMRDMISEGAVPAEQGLQILTDGILAGTDGVNGATVAFGGLAKELGNTRRGAIANFFTAIDRLGAKVLDAFTEITIVAAKTGTTIVDAIGSAFQSLAEAIARSPVLGLLQIGMENLATAVSAAADALKPAFDFIADGLVAVGTAAGALFVLRRIPRILSAIGIGITRLLTPMNLLITAGVLIGGFLTRLVRESPDLQAALTNVASALQLAFAPIVDLVRALVPNLAALGSIFADILEGLAEKIVQIAVPALERFASFIENTVAPAIHSFVIFLADEVIPVIGRGIERAVEIAVDVFGDLISFIRTTVIPVVQRGIVRAVEFATAAFETLSDFVRTEVLPVVGPALSDGAEIALSAFRSLYDWLSGTFVPFIQSDLVPVIAGLGAALGLALTGNLPLAGLAAGLGLAVAALRNNDIRNALVDGIKAAVEEARDFLGGLIDDGLLGRIAVGALRIARTIGRTIGGIVSDPAFVKAVAAIGAGAVALGGAFIVGFGEGVLDNIPDLVRLMSEALTKVFQEALELAFRNPVVFAGLAAALTGGAALLALRRSGQRLGQILTDSVVQGTKVGPGQAGFGGGTKGFVSALFGGRAAIQSQVQAETQFITRTFQRAFQQQQRIIQAATGSTLRDGGRLLSTSNVGDFKRVSARVGELTNELGAARLGGLLLRDSLSRIRQGFTQRDINTLRNGFRDVGASLKLAGRQAAIAAGTLAGGLFAAAFVSQAIFAIEASGTERLTSALGLAASAITTGAIIGGKAGVVAGAAVAGVGLLTSALQRNAEKAKIAEAAIDAYAAAIDGAAPDQSTADALEANFLKNLREESTETVNAIRKAGIEVEEFLAVASDPKANFAGRFRAAVLELEKMDGAAYDGAAALSFLETEFERIQDAVTREGAIDRFLEGSEVVEEVTDKFSAQREAIRLSGEAARAYRDRLNELNEERLDQTRDHINETKDALSDAEQAASDAMQAVRDFLTGAGAELDLEQATSQGVINIANLADEIPSRFAEAAEQGGTVWAATMSVTAQEVRDEAAAIFEAGNILNAEDARAALQPLIDAAIEQGGDAGSNVAAILEEEIAKFETPEFLDLADAATQAQDLVNEVQNELDFAEAALKFQLTVDPETIPGFKEEAFKVYEEAAAESIAGYTEGLAAGQGETSEAVAEYVDQITTDLKAGLGIDSPSTVFATAGEDSGAGYALGLEASIPAGAAAAQALGEASAVAMRSTAPAFLAAGQFAGVGFATGIFSKINTATAAARSLALAAVAEFRRVFQITSPSRVTRALGEQVAQGLALGINGPASVNAVTAAATRLGRTAYIGIAKPFYGLGKEIGKAISQGIADTGSEVIGAVQGIIADAGTSGLSRSQILQQTNAQVAASLFQGAAPSRLPGGPTRGDLAFARLDVSTIFRDLKAANQGLQDEVQAARDAVREGTASRLQRELLSNAGVRSLSTRTIGGQTNQRAFLDALQGIRTFAEQLLASGASVESVNKEIRTYRDGLVRQGRSLGFANDAMLSLIETMGLSNAQLAVFAREVNAAAAAAATPSQPTPTEEDEQPEPTFEEEEEPVPVVVPPPIFRDLVINTPAGDPEAVGLVAANRVAFAIGV